MKKITITIEDADEYRLIGDEIFRVDKYNYPKEHDPFTVNKWDGEIEYDPCKHCSNNRANGGSGFCCCSLPHAVRNITIGPRRYYTTSVMA